MNVIIFDLDGTLLDTLSDLTDATNAMLRHFDLPLRTKDEVRTFVGNGIPNLLRRAVPTGHPASAPGESGELSALLAFFNTYYGEHCEDNTRPYEGILPLLDELKKRNIQTAVVSNKADFAVKKLIPAYFGDRIDIACGEDEAHGIGKKPAPEMVLRVLEQLNATPSDAIYVGDSDVDIDTAANAGIPCISVLWGFRSRKFLLEHGAKVLIEKPEELLKFCS